MTLDRRTVARAFVNRPVSLPDWWEGAIESTSPLRVRVRGGVPDSTPDDLVGDLTVDASVWGVTVNGRSVILGRFGGEADSGWIDATLTSGLTGYLRYRVRGDTTWLRLDVSGTISGTTVWMNDPLPADILPIGATVHALAPHSDPNTSMPSCWLDVGGGANHGQVGARALDDTSITRLRANTSWTGD